MVNENCLFITAKNNKHPYRFIVSGMIQQGSEYLHRTVM